MRVMILVKGNRESEAGVLPSEELIRAMGAFNEHLVEAGVLLAGDGLQPTSKGKRIRCSGKERSVTDGPFPESNVPVAGFWLWEVGAMDDAVEWIRRSPFQDAEVEIRPIMEPEDFGDALPADVLAKERELRGKGAAQSH